MSLFDKTEKACCRIKCGSKSGSGFFIGQKQIITAAHVLSEAIFETSKIEIEVFNCTEDGITLKALLIDHCSNCDVALIQIVGDFKIEHPLALCDSLIIEGEEWISFGYPETKDGITIGERLKGEIDRFIINGDGSPKDVNILPKYFNPQYIYEAFSGSPVLNYNGDVLSIILDRNDKYLSAVSVNKMNSFLQKHGIEVKPDQLDSFENYNKDVFIGFGELKETCEVESTMPLGLISPTNILVNLNQDLFYPKKQKTPQEIIAYLRCNKEIDNQLWKGWIELLTYIEILKGEYSEINNLSIYITINDIEKLYGFIPKRKSIVNLKLELKFFFTENEDYFKIAKTCIHSKNKMNQDINRKCFIFNSHVKNFGRRPLLLSDKHKIVTDISGGDKSGFRVLKAEFALLSLHQLSTEVIKSDTLLQASTNLQQLFKNALN